VSAPDPMRSFPRVLAAALLLETVVVLLALPVVAKLGDGLATWQGVLVGALALALAVTAGLVRRPWGIGVGLGLQVVMIACWVVEPALGILGLVFLAVWIYLLWLRREVARRISESSDPVS
jgi:uncharacterized protein DUF4233